MPTDKPGAQRGNEDFWSVCLLFINNCVKVDGLELELLELEYYITLI